MCHETILTQGTIMETPVSSPVGTVTTTHSWSSNRPAMTVHSLETSATSPTILTQIEVYVCVSDVTDYQEM